MSKTIQCAATAVVTASIFGLGALAAQAQSSYMGPVVNSTNASCQNDYESYGCTVFSLQPDSGYFEVLLVEPFNINSGTPTWLFKVSSNNTADVWYYHDGEPMTYVGYYVQNSDACVSPLPYTQQPRNALLADPNSDMPGLCIY